MYPILLKLGAVEVHAYGFFIAIAFIVGILLTVRYGRREGISPSHILDLAIYIIIGAIAGSRLFYVIGQWDYYLRNPLEAFMVQRGGLVFLGGFVFCLSATIIYARLKKIPLLKLFDATAPGVSLGYAIARIGCFLNGCCFGLPTSSPCGVVFPAGSTAAMYFPGEAVYPTQLFSLASMLVVFFIMVWLYRRKKFDGEIAFWWFILYSVYRFAVEFIRFSPIHWLGLTPSQWLVIPLFIFGLWGLYHYRRAPGA